MTTPTEQAALAEQAGTPPIPPVVHPSLERPDAFTQDQLGWVAWLEPRSAADLTEEQQAGLLQRSRAASPYFRLLAEDPPVLAARTHTDFDIFHSTEDGLRRGERELAAAVASRVNGCVFCASVHARFASHHSGRHDQVQRLLDEGPTALIDDDDPAWSAIAAAAVALSGTPAGLGAEHVAALRAAGLADLDIFDLVNATSFFAWANRLMLSLGEPEVIGT
ncbi:alkylhydroperoxidase domain protein [Raineyella fluvialis]|uniref:Alkylhydroperoxidase domain protein n=1 Tax=Raineyella fluvialis TaxID=2662261 RepID=A0A5Q2F691_9ACTN|nr:alkylhydroperoxidase domain protein [Raineyella fluvialis]QGF22482.1 alkylhydroperoxidase domain protein [Raineyella fluvialis]